MSTQSIQRNIERTQKDIESNQKKLTAESKKEAQKSGKIAGLRKSIATTKSPSLIKSKLNEVARLENDLVQIQKNKASGQPNLY